MDDIKRVSTVKYALAAFIISIIFRYIWTHIFHMTSPGSVPNAVGSVMVAAYWFARSVGRIPLPRERWSFFFQFTGMILALHLFFATSLKSTDGLSSNVILLVFLYLSPYPLFAYAYFGEYIMKKMIKKS